MYLRLQSKLVKENSIPKRRNLMKVKDELVEEVYVKFNIYRSLYWTY